MPAAETYYVAWEDESSLGRVFLSPQSASNYAGDPLRVLKTTDPIRATNFAQNTFRKVSGSVKRLNKEFKDEQRNTYRRRYESRGSDMRRNHGHR